MSSFISDLTKNSKVNLAPIERKVLEDVFLDISDQPTDPPFFELNLFVIGGAKVGKSTLIASLVQPPQAVLLPLNLRSKDSIPYFKRVFYVSNIPILVTFWDLPSSFEHKEIVCRLCKNAATGVILMYDELQQWVQVLDLLTKEGTLKVPGVVLGNKLDVTLIPIEPEKLKSKTSPSTTTILHPKDHMKEEELETQSKSLNEFEYSRIRQRMVKTFQPVAFQKGEVETWATHLNSEVFLTSALNYDHLTPPLERLLTSILEKFTDFNFVSAETLLQCKLRPLRRLVPKLEIRYKNLIEMDMQVVNPQEPTENKKNKKQKN